MRRAMTVACAALAMMAAAGCGSKKEPGQTGADGPRRYFIAFTTPAEMRGLGGFMRYRARHLRWPAQIGHL